MKTIACPMSTPDELAALYVESLAAKRSDLLSRWELLRSGQGDAETVRAVWRQLHQLSGSAGAYGFHGLGDAARLLENACASWLAADAAGRETEDRFSRRCQGDFDELDYQLESRL